MRFLLALLRFRLLLLGEDVAKSGNIKSITVFILVYFCCCSMAWSDVFNWIFYKRFSCLIIGSKESMDDG